ncbi:MAG: alpha/beta fold hydrolase [Acidimicrobiia bacterium]
MIVTTADGTRLAVDDTGEGTPLVLVHGWCSDRRAWDDMIGALGPGLRVIALDRRGHGQSDAPDGGYSIAGHADDLRCVLDALAVGSVVLVAHAGGAPGAMEFTRRHPERVLALVLVDTMLRDGPLRSADGEPSPLEHLAASIGTADGRADRDGVDPDTEDLGGAHMRRDLRRGVEGPTGGGALRVGEEPSVPGGEGVHTIGGADRRRQVLEW